MTRRMTMLLSIGALAALIGCPGLGPIGVPITFSTAITGDQEVPPVETPGSGQGTFTLNAERTELAYEITADGLTGPVTAAHFHRGAVGVNGPPVFTIPGTPTDSGDDVRFEGTWRFSESDVDDFEVGEILTGRVYVNLHTEAFPAGEIRGQLIPILP